MSRTHARNYQISINFNRVWLIYRVINSNFMEKICNQHFVKDTHRDKRYNGTVKCSCCGEESNWVHPYPFEMKKFIKWLDDFTKLHKNKGCNKVRIDIQEWESKEVSLGVAI